MSDCDETIEELGGRKADDVTVSELRSMQHKTYLSTNTLMTTKAPPGKGGSILQMKLRQRSGRLSIVSTLGAHEATEGADGGGLMTL